MKTAEQAGGPTPVTNFTYTISSAITPGIILPSTLPGARGIFDPPLPVDSTTHTRKLNPGDTVKFMVDPTWSSAKMHMDVAPFSRMPKPCPPQFPFNDVHSSPVSVLMPGTGPVILTVSENVGAWKIWFELEDHHGNICLIADPEVQTQTGGGGNVGDDHHP